MFGMTLLMSLPVRSSRMQTGVVMPVHSETEHHSHGNGLAQQDVDWK